MVHKTCLHGKQKLPTRYPKIAYMVTKKCLHGIQKLPIWYPTISFTVPKKLPIQYLTSSYLVPKNCLPNEAISGYQVNLVPGNCLDWDALSGYRWPLYYQIVLSLQLVMAGAVKDQRRPFKLRKLLNMFDYLSKSFQYHDKMLPHNHTIWCTSRLQALLILKAPCY